MPPQFLAQLLVLLLHLAVTMRATPLPQSVSVRRNRFLAVRRLITQYPAVTAPSNE
jgi:hypothetical protein